MSASAASKRAGSRGVTIGHRNITQSVDAMDALLFGLGFDIIQNGALIRTPVEFVEYGRLARKRSIGAISIHPRHYSCFEEAAGGIMHFIELVIATLAVCLVGCGKGPQGEKGGPGPAGWP